MINSWKALALAALLTGASVAVHAESKQLTIGITQEFDTLNPLISTMAASTYIYYTIDHPLNAIDADWNWKCWLCTKMPTFENGLAKRTKVGGKDTIVANWEIREGAKWGDGTPITGHDVKMSWEIGSSPNVAVAAKDVWEKVAAIDVDPKNPRKFKITYADSRFDFYQMATFYILPAHVEGPVWEKTKGQMGAYEKQSKYVTEPTNPGLYSGPYLVKEVKLGSHVTVERNPHFYGTPAKIDRLVFRLITNTQTLEANLLSGTIDMVSELGMTFDQALDFEKRVKADEKLGAKYTVLFRDGMNYEHITFNLRNPIFQDVRVRKALLHAVNRQDLVNALFDGKQKVALHGVHPLDVYFTSDVQKYEHNPDAAAKILDEAGWKVGADGIRAKDGKKLTLTLMTTSQNKVRELVQVYLQQEWKKIGVEVNMKNEPARVFFGETVRKGAFPDMAMFAWISAPDTPPRSTLHSSEIPSETNGFKGRNSGAWANVVVDRTLDKVRSEFDLKKRKSLMSVIQKEYTKDLPDLPLYIRADVVVVPARLKNFRVTGHQFYSVLSANQWDLQ